MITINEHYAIATHSSTEHGEYAETGTNFMRQAFTFRELVDYIERNGFNWTSDSHVGEDCGHVWLETGPEHDYFTGEDLYKTLHLATPNDKRAMRYWRKAMVYCGVIKGKAA